MDTSKKLDYPFICQHAEKRGEFLTGNIFGMNLYTALQPIYSIAHKRAVGYEALLRVQDRKKSEWIRPDRFFKTLSGTFDAVHVDRLSRHLHLGNFQIIQDPINWLFLNVSPETIIHADTFAPFFSDLLQSHRFPAHKIVIEVVEQPIEDNNQLLGTIDYYKQLGCLIAIDDFGSGHSNFDRIWTLKPDIVKLDRSVLIRASRQKNIRDLLPGIVSLLHQAGSLVLIEGIETHEQAVLAIESDVDFVQGFFFGRPFTELSAPPKPFDNFDGLLNEFKSGARAEDELLRKKIDLYSAAFKKAVDSLTGGDPLKRAAGCLTGLPAVVRCYQIGTDGIQIGNTIVAPAAEARKNKRFQPLDDARSADWFRRHYLKRAIFHPDQLQVSRPYLSITGAHMCVTLSMMMSGLEKQSVLCCDLAV